MEYEMREALAALMHEMRSGWMQYSFWDDDRVVIPAWAVEQWMRQMDTPYAELSEGEKDSDRREADKVLALLNEYFAEAGRIYEKPRTLKSPAIEANLRCPRCNKLTTSLTTEVVIDDDGNEAVMWLCNGCISRIERTDSWYKQSQSHTAPTAARK